MLTPEQRAALKADIFGDPARAALARDWEWAGLMAYYNTPSDSVCWRSLVPIDEVGIAMDSAELATLPPLQHVKLQTLGVYLVGGIKPALESFRAFFEDSFTAESSPKTRAALAALWRRPMTRLEALFAGKGTTDSPATLVVDGEVGAQELSDVTGKPPKPEAKAEV